MGGRKHRRANGEGSIYQRASDGKWCGALVVDGKRVVVYADSHRDARAKLRQKQAAADQGLPVASPRVTLKDFLVRWLDESVKVTAGEKTLRTYKDLIRVHLDTSDIAGVALNRLTVEHIQRWLNTVAEKPGRREGQKISPKTVKACRDALRAALNVAIQWNLIARNPAAVVKVRNAGRSMVEPLSRDQARAFLAAVKGHRLEALFVLAVSLGLREGEVIGLRLTDIDLGARRLHVRRQLQRVAGKVTELEPKASSRRSVLLPAFVVERIKAQLAQRERERRAAKEAWTESGYLFTTRVGSPLDARNLLRDFYPIRNACGRPDLRFHDLRHSAATILHVAGVPVKAIQALLGHASDRTTRDIYMHVVADAETAAADAMEELFGVDEPGSVQ